jgi:hypothetical protein
LSFPTKQAEEPVASTMEWRDGYAWNSYSPQRVVRRKEEWAGKSLAHAYDHCMSWTYRQMAQREFMTGAKNAQKAVHELLDEEPQEGRELAAKLQLSAFHTSYPSPAQVAIGHTAFLELKRATRSMSKDFAEQCYAVLAGQRSTCAPKAFRSLVKHVAEALAARAVLEEASRHSELSHVEYYRLFQASQCSMKFRYLKDCIEAVVIFGDLLPDTKSLTLHPMTRQLLDTVMIQSRIFLLGLPRAEVTNFRKFFTSWARDIVKGLLPYLPEAKPETKSSTGGRAGRALSSGKGGNALPGVPAEESEYRYGDESNGVDMSGRLPPLDAPQPPILAKESRVEDALKAALDPSPPGDSPGETQDSPDTEPSNEERELAGALSELQETALGASAQTSDYGDRREDLLEQELARSSFSEGPIEGTPTEGRIVEFEMEGDAVGGELKDRSVELSDDAEKVDRLEAESAPIAAALRGLLYPSEEERTRIELVHTSGALDPKRLAFAEVCDAAYRRFRVRKEPSPTGKAVLLIAADGSGSLSDPQMHMCKLVMSSWLRSASRTSVEVLAALYHSDSKRALSGSPLVQWTYHPRKTPIFDPSEAIRAVASLPDCGTGAQSDALSLKFMLDEAIQVAKGCRVYLTLISDCAWNKSFHETDKSPEEEVAAVLEGFQAELGDRLHITLVALEERDQERINEVVDKVVSVDEEALSHPEQVAQQIGQYVASCIRERRRAPRRRAF